MDMRTASVGRTDEPRDGRDRVPVNLSLPRDLVAALDGIAGPRRRSAFAEEALWRAVRRDRFRIAGERFAGSLDPEQYPYWRTPEDVTAWVRDMRTEESTTDVVSE